LPLTRHRSNLDCVGSVAKLRKWQSLTRDTGKDIKRV